mmetsp:Transcript_14770/g.31531  ORF Transcript_14770/g.31531 Transcript_14770/m.31531 type:complete len:573 (+) Transcript_14770:66-1784(+)
MATTVIRSTTMSLRIVLFLCVFFLLSHNEATTTTATAFVFTGSFAVSPRPGRISTSYTGSVLLGANNREGLYKSQNKTFEEEQFINIALLKNSLFADLSDDLRTQLVDAFERGETKEGGTIVSQGDSCDGGYVYLISEGQCRVVVDEKVVPEPYGIIGPGAFFGELGILYESTRTATVKANRDVTYYQLPGDLCKNIVQDPMDSQSWSDIKEIDDAINQVSGTNALYGGNVILPYKPERSWLWRQYTGTVLKISLTTTVMNVLICAVFIVYARIVTGVPLWTISVGAPDQSLPFIEGLSYLGNIWSIQQPLATFILTFFLNQGYDFWKQVYQLARDVQTGLSDFNLVATTNIKRDEDGMATAESSKYLDDIALYARLFHVLMWASKSEQFSCLTTPEGLRRMNSRGIMTIKELEALQSLKVPNDRLFLAPLEWMMIRSIKAVDDGILPGDNATKGQLMNQMVAIRNKQDSISNKIDGRMPLAYTHFVQILVDTLVFTSPFALYAKFGDLSIFAVCVITFFYTGLNNLAKIFLDPLNNENFKENSIFMDLGVFMRETNVDSEQPQKMATKLPF